MLKHRKFLTHLETGCDGVRVQVSGGRIPDDRVHAYEADSLQSCVRCLLYRCGRGRAALLRGRLRRIASCSGLLLVTLVALCVYIYYYYIDCWGIAGALHRLRTALHCFW